ncbi:MAG: outer membrane protein assembly factor BamD [Myxococcota bacterium]
MMKQICESTRILGAVAGVVVLNLGCASTLLREAPKTAEEYYARGVEDTDDGLYPEALQTFAALKSKFPYSKYAALAELRIGDVHFERGRYIEAVDGYRNFLKYHPQHEEGSYAMYRIAGSYREQIPVDLFILPPAAEKDQGSTRLAISAYKDMLTRYPDSKESEKAKEELDSCRRQLADHEIYVAEFYFKRERWKAAAMRAEGLLKDYSGLGLDAEALIISAESRFNLDEYDAALEAAARIQNEFPESSEAGRARDLLERAQSLRSTTPTSDDPPKKG